MKPTVFNYQEYERVVEENKKLNAEVADLRIRCRIADGDKRDCKSCKHQKPDGCSRWECEYEPVMSDLISRQAAIDECDKQYPNIDRQDFKAVINAVPSAEVVLQTPQTYGKSINPNTEIASDLISRADAIDTVEELNRKVNDGTWYGTICTTDVLRRINAIPSADRPTGEWISEELANMICNEICYYKEVTVDADSLNDLCEGCLIKKKKYGRPIGEWIEEDEYGDLWVCDQCGFASEYRDNYCPHCGAKMRGEKNDKR